MFRTAPRRCTVAWSGAVLDRRPEFDLDRHLVVLRYPNPVTATPSTSSSAQQRSTPLDPAHPMWRIHLLQGYQGGERGGDPLPPLDRRRHPVDPGDAGAAGPAGRRSGRFTARVGRRGAVHPSRATARHHRAQHRAERAEDRALERIRGPRSRDGRAGEVAWRGPIRCPLEVLKEIATATGTTVNDVCTTLVSGAMARYLVRGRARGDRPCPRVTTTSPGWCRSTWSRRVGSRRPSWATTSRSSWSCSRTGSRRFADRLAEVHRRMARIRESWEPTLTFGLSRAIALAPVGIGSAAINFLASKAVGVLTDVPGPRTQMALAGAPVAGVVGWAPTSARAGPHRHRLQLRRRCDRRLRHRPGRRAGRRRAGDRARRGARRGGPPHRGRQVLAGKRPSARSGSHG